MQNAIFKQALALFNEKIETPQIKRSPFVWNSDQSWRNNYLKVDSSNREQLKREGNIRRKEQKLVESSGVNRMTLAP